MVKNLKGEVLHISPAGVAFIKGYEKEVLRVYNDGYGYLTVGVGHRVGPSDHLKLNNPILKSQSDAFFAHDLAIHAQPVDSLVTVPLTQNQYDALVSLVYNIGGPNFKGSTLLKKLNAADYAATANRFGEWVHSAGRVSKGLINRRAAEKKMFLAGA